MGFMFEDMPIDDGPEKRPWRPVVFPYRPHVAPRARARKPLPGQRYLPGLEPSEPASECSLTTAKDENIAELQERTDASGTAVRCPNCGSSDFDDDGDCTNCWEPGVVRPYGPNASSS